MKNWKGKWLMLTAVGHTAFALFKYGGAYLTVIDDGVFNSVTSLPVGLSVWFILFGFVLFKYFSIDFIHHLMFLEKRSSHQLLLWLN